MGSEPLTFSALDVMRWEPCWSSEDVYAWFRNRLVSIHDLATFQDLVDDPKLHNDEILWVLGHLGAYNHPQASLGVMGDRFIFTGNFWHKKHRVGSTAVSDEEGVALLEHFQEEWDAQRFPYAARE